MPTHIRAYLEKASITDNKQDTFLESYGVTSRISAAISFAVVSERYLHQIEIFQAILKCRKTRW